MLFNVRNWHGSNLVFRFASGVSESTLLSRGKGIKDIYTINILLARFH